MEIYNLSDEIPEKGSKRSACRIADKEVVDERSVSGATGEVRERSASEIAENRGGADLVITDLKQGVKNPERVNVFINGRYSFSLDVAQVVDLKIKIGLVVTPEKLAEYKKASEFGKAYQRALEWVLVRPRSEQELREYLRRSKYKAEIKERQKEWQEARERENDADKWWNERAGEWQDERQVKKKRAKSNKAREEYDFSELICQRLTERGYVNDKRFAEYYVENRFVKKGVSRRRLEMELRSKGIEDGIIREVLEGRDETEEIKKMIAKKRGKYDDEKLINYLVRQGFSYQLVQSLVRECEKD